MMCPILVDWSEIYIRLRNDDNDARAWEALCLQVRSWARRELQSLGAEAIEDAVADTCSSSVVNLDQARGASTFRGFVLGNFLNCRRRAIRLSRAPVVSLTEIESISIEEPVSGSFQADLLQACLASLGDRELRAIQLRFEQEADGETVARELGVSHGAARQILFRTLARLRRCMHDRAAETRDMPIAPIPIEIENHGSLAEA